jgi:hypothetical protein
LTLFVFLSFSCNFGNEQKGIRGPGQSNEGSNLIPANPVHITWDGPRNEEDIEAYKAEVSIYTMNNRYDTGAYLTDSYGLSVKRINNKIYTRIYMRPDETGRMRSAVSDGNELVIFDSHSGSVEFRTSLASGLPQEMDVFSNMTALGRLNLSLIRREAKRLAFDTIENEEAQAFVLSLPSTLFNMPGEDRISTKAVFDTDREVLNHVETVSYLNDGIKKTITTIPVYQEYQKNQIKTGQVTTVEVQNPNKIQGFDENTKIYNSLDEIPKLSEEEYQSLKEQGKLKPAGPVVLGDPADQSYTITIVEQYTDVEINNVVNKVFRVIGGI